MAAETQDDPLPQDYSAWERDFSEEPEEEVASPRWNSRSILGGLAVFGLVSVLACYAGTRTWSDAAAPLASSSPTGTTRQQVENEFARSLREIEALKIAVSELSSTNQQIVMSIAALQSELQELRKQMATPSVAKQKPALTTGSISARPKTHAASKPAERAPLRLAPPQR